MALFMMVMVAYYAHKYKYGSDSVFAWSRFGKGMFELAVTAVFAVVLYHVWQSETLGGFAKFGAPLIAALIIDKVFKLDAFMALLTPVILIGGMLAGMFTPTEAAVAGVAWALFLGFVWYRTLNLKMFTKISFETAETTASVLFIVAAASIFAWVLTTTQVTTSVAQWVLAISASPWVFLLLANGLLLFVGCFMETIAAITILVPVLLPIVLELGIDPVHFGVVMVLNLMIGLVTPPVGMVLFVMARISRIGFESTVRAVLPWLIPLLLTLLIITFVPSLVMWLPNLLYR
jgi:tripartite ATP-independent transporter DctM subunit